MNRKNVSKIIICISFIIIFGIIFPIVIDLCIFGNNFPSNISNSDWSGFLGSFWGGIIGGIGTLIAVFITSSDTRAIQEENIHQQNMAEKKDQLKNIVDIISRCWQKMKIIEEARKQIVDITSSLRKTQDNIYEIDADLKNVVDLENGKSLENEKQNLINDKSKYKLLLEQQRSRGIETYEKFLYEVMMLELLIKDIDFSESLLDSIRKFENLYNIAEISTKADLQNVDIISEQFNVNARTFIELYKNTFIK